MNITIRRATLEDKPAIFAFLDQAYGDKARYKHPERWEWQFVYNPYKPSTELPVWIAITEEGKVVGQSCAMYERIKVGESTESLAWALDAYVLEDFRGLNLGFETLHANAESNNLWAGLSMAESSRHILAKLGCFPIDKVSVYRRRLRIDGDSVRNSITRRFEKNIIGQKLLRLFGSEKLFDVIAFLVNLFFGGRDLVKKEPVDDSIKIIEVTEFEKSFDTWWDLVKRDYPVIVQRDSKFLNWKYCQQPFINYHKFLATKNNEIFGYLVLRCAMPPESNIGIIADLLVLRKDEPTLSTLLDFSILYFKQRNMNIIEVASSVDEYINTFKRFGFHKFKDMRPLARTINDSLFSESLSTPGSWFLGRSDHDWDQYPLG